MDSDFMNNLANMLKNGNVPEEMKAKMGQFFNQNSNQDASNSFNESAHEQNDTCTSSSSNTNTMNPEMLQNLMKMFMNSSKSSNTEEQTSQSSNSPNIDMNMLFKMKSIMEKMQTSKNDPRSNLLLSLKPYLKESRKSKVEQYVQLLNMTKIMEAFSENGGENIK